MATKTLTSRIILRNDTANNWTTNNPVLLKGEIGLETDTGKYKIGNGTSNWQALQYYVNLDQDSKTSLDTLIEMLDDDSFGKVNDVQVNGTTVVENKVANISIGVLTTSATAQSEVTAGESFTNNIVLHKVAKTGNYNDLLNKLNVVDNLDSTSTTDALSANQGSVLKSMVQALPSAKSFTNIQAMITAINSYSNTEMNVGTSIYLQEMEVPDFWVYSKADSSVAYTYTDDSAFISAVETSGYVQVGYYNIAMLETAKVDLTDYYSKEEVDTLLSEIDLSAYVDLTSDQVIGGDKEFEVLKLSAKLAFEQGEITDYGGGANQLKVAYGNGIFVAVGYGDRGGTVSEGNTAFISTNGEIWNTSTLPSNGLWTGVAYGNGVFVAIKRNSSSVAYSSNGIDWEETITNDNITDLSYITYGNNVFFAVDDYNTHSGIYSTDGVTWTYVNNLPSDYNYGGLMAGNGVFVIPYSAFNGCNVSDNLNSWTYIDIEGDTSSSLSDCSFINNTFICIKGYPASSGFGLYSEDGANWTKFDLPTLGSGYWSRVCGGNSYFVLVSSSGYFAYSKDLTVWQVSSIGQSYSGLGSGAFGNNKITIFARDSATARIPYPYYMDLYDSIDVRKELENLNNAINKTIKNDDILILDGGTSTITTTTEG